MQGTLPIPGPLTLGDLLDRAFRLYRARFATLVLTAATLLVPYAIVTGLLLGTATGSYWEALAELGSESAGAQSPDRLAAMLSYMGLALMLGVLGLVVNAIVTLALTYQAVFALHGDALSVRETLLGAWDRLWTLIRMEIVRGLAYFGAGTAAVTPMACVAVLGAASLGMAFEGVDNSLVVGGLTLMLLCAYGLAILAVLVPVVYLTARWVAAVPGLVAQDWGPVEALQRSWRLTKGHAWRCVGYVVLLGLLGFLLTNLPVTVIQWGVTLLLPPSFMAWTGVSSAIGAVFQVLWQPLNAAALVLFYYDLRVRREGYDLALRLEQLEATLAPDEVVDQHSGAGAPADNARGESADGSAPDPVEA